MRVTHVTTSYSVTEGGVARCVNALAIARPAGTCTVLTTSPGHAGVENVHGVRIVRLARQFVVHSQPTGSVSVALGLHLRRLSAECDVLHAHLPFPALLGLAFFARAQTPWVVSYHNELQSDLVVARGVRLLHDLLLRRFLARARAVLVSTADYAAACSALADVRHKVHIIPYGVDATAFAARAQAAGLQRASDVLLYVGRLAYYKGLDVLLRALTRLPQARLVVVGDGPEAARLRRMAAELGLARRVEWRGRVPDADLPLLYGAVAALVLPSTGMSESFGLVQLEAHACGTPVVSSALPGVRQVNLHGITGLQVPPGDAESLCQALQRLLADADLRSRLGEQARRHVREHFGLRCMIDAVEAVYAGVLSGVTTRSPLIASR